MEPFSFHHELNRNMDSPLNHIQRQVKQYMSTPQYEAYASAIYPLDRAVHMYNSHYKALLSCFRRIKKQGYYNEDGRLQTDVLLMDALTGVHGYLSVQFSLFNILKKHAHKQSAQNELLDAYNQFMGLKISEFFLAFNNNILHGVNFSTLLQFHSGREEAKLVYYVSEFLKVDQWQNLQDYLSRFDEFITIEDLIPEYHNHVCDFFYGYETVLFKNNFPMFNDVLARLGSYAIEYDKIGQKGYLPVSQSYLRKKLKFMPEGFL